MPASILSARCRALPDLPAVPAPDRGGLLPKMAEQVRAAGMEAATRPNDAAAVAQFGSVLLAYAMVAYYVALVLTRRRLLR